MAHKWNRTELEVRWEILQALQDAYENAPLKGLAGKELFDRLADANRRNVLTHLTQGVEYLRNSGFITQGERFFAISSTGTEYLNEHRAQISR
jgi:hypothetical protein